MNKVRINSLAICDIIVYGHILVFFHRILKTFKVVAYLKAAKQT